MEYQADDNFSVIGRGVYVGKADIFNESLQVPSHMTYDLGVNYKTKINATPVTFSAMCYNLTDKNYWDAHTGNGLILSNPRTFMLSAEQKRREIFNRIQDIAVEEQPVVPLFNDMAIAATSSRIKNYGAINKIELATDDE